MKPKPAEMSPEIRQMIDLRHQAEQRGHFEPLGRLLSLQTAHGMIEFGTHLGEATGPDIAQLASEGELLTRQAECREDFKLGAAILRNVVKPGQVLLVLGAWTGLPALRKNSSAPCKKCLHICDVCDGFGKKQCEGVDCGGRGWIGGKWISCPGAGCHAATGQYKVDCERCAKSEVRGMIREQVICLLCKGEMGPHGFSMMTCSGCRGTKKRSTGRVNGSLDWRLPNCKACAGTGWKGELVKQDVAKFTNAELQSIDREAKYPNRIHGPGAGKSPALLALGPIHAFTIKDFSSNQLRAFEVSQDAAGDFLALLVPKVLRGSRSKAYLVGGVVRESGSGERVA